MTGLKLVRWIPDFDFRNLSHLDGTLTKLIGGYKLKNGQALVITSKGWHRLRLVARLANRAVMIIPETNDATLDQLAAWVKMALVDGVVMLDEYKAMIRAAA